MQTLLYRAKGIADAELARRTSHPEKGIFAQWLEKVIASHAKWKPNQSDDETIKGVAVIPY